MGMDELEDAKGEGENASAAAQPQQGAPPANETEEERNSRVDAAKAFFRAMYAGEEPPASFGQPQEQPKSDTSTQTACRNCEAMEFSLKEAEAKTNEAETLYKRMAADFENYRRRMERQGEEAVSLGVKKAAEAMVPALDDLDRAMMYLNPDLPAEKLIESFKLVSNRILQCMEQLGVKPIQAVGEMFDPKFHEPVQQIETTEHADGEVMSELRRGYMLHDKVVRPALVNVASNSTGVVTKPGAQQEAATSPAESEAPPAEASTSEPGPSAEAIEQAQPASEGLPEPPPPPAAEEEDFEDTKVYELEDLPEV